MGVNTAKTKLILFPSSGKSRDLAQSIGKILIEDYHLGERVQVLRPYSAKEFKDDPEVSNIPKGHHRPLVVDFFADGDPRVEGGEEEFQAMNRQYVAVVNYLYDPTSGRSINDQFLQTIAMLY
ncbi:MAG: hypothetical protein KKE20_03415, partial [Nanoarchaeota archaeon]|nr:hypothetical protein [Nanoarchaeota archaeon]